MASSSILKFFRSWLWCDILVPFVFTRLGILLIGVAAIHLGTTHGPWHVSPHSWIDMWARWDSGFYNDIAASGYTYSAGEMSNVAFFPLYPLLIRLVAFGTQDAQLLTVVGCIISNLATILAFIVIHQLITESGYPQSMARRTIWLLALFPTSFFLSVTYTEGLFLFLTVSAFYCARHRWWLAAGILGGASAATRSIGILLVIPLGYEWLKQKPRRWSSALALLLIPCGLLAYMLYLERTFGEPLLFVKAQAAWGRTTGIAEASRRIKELLMTPGPGARAIRVATDMAFLVLGCILLVGVFWRQPPSYQLYALYALAVPLATFQLMSIPRFMIVIFPLFIAMGQWLGKAPFFYLTLLACGLLQAVLVVRWSLWYWVA